MKRSNILCFVLILGITLCGCQTQPAKTSTTKQQLDQMDYESDDDFELSLQSSIGKEQCFICGTPAGGLLEYYRKFDSIGIIHWADMSVTDTRIREYDDNGNEKIDSGHMSTMINSFGEDYGSIMTHSQPDRCIAEPNIHLGEKDTIDCETLKDQLCQDCLDKVCEFYEDQVNSDNDEYLESTGYSLIDFTTGELYTRLLQEQAAESHTAALTTREIGNRPIARRTVQGSHRTLQLGVDVPGISSINDILHLSLTLHQLVHLIRVSVIFFETELIVDVLVFCECIIDFLHTLHHVFLHGLVLVERRILRQVAHRVAWAPNHLTLGRLLKSCDDFHQRRFTGTVQTDDADFCSVEER